ncbi:hypothetical protein DQ04_10921000 [Trypanosoma grayi]|uniref:hypothetical protein n=1 Tax=Trypanosoma grayi TaxID=71804 RepID=UPI0004F4609F|nr:hypothetical protein DQ04_10921000 [Trypanosoma grayi]KEG07096.1 hypothetical protein DQ04_10921000 [Trypanosoma grayi]
MIQSIFSVAKTMLEKEDKSKKGNTTAPTDSSNDNAAPRPTVQGGEGRAPSPANPASNEQHREEPQEPGQREEEGGRQQQQDNSCKEENGTAAVEAQEEKTETKREETKTSEDAVPPVTDERSIAQVLAVVDGTEPTQRFQAQEQQPSCTPDMPPAEVAVSSAVEANASNNSAVDPSNSKQQQSEEELESQKHESHQQQHAAVPVMPHHVFSEEEVAALMEKRRLREQALQEEQRQAASKRSSVASASSTRRSLGDASGWRNTSVDANAARVSLPPFYAAAAAPGSAPLAHPLAHQPLYPRASLASPAADVPLPPPPPYPHIIAADDNAALKSRPHTQQPQPQAVCGPWGFQPQFMGFPHVYGAPAAFDPASMLLNAQQQQQQPGVSDPSASILAPPPVQPNGMGMSMQELGVLARLIVLAQNNPQQQQQQQNFFPPQLPLPQQQQQQQYYYYYPQRGRQENVTHFVNPLNQQPVATHIKVDPLASSSNLQDSAPPTNVVPMLEKDVKLVAAPVTEHQNSTQV